MKLIRYDFHKNKFTFQEKNGKTTTLKYKEESRLDIDTTNISCGIYQVAGLNDLADDVKNFTLKHKKEGLYTYKFQKDIFKSLVKGFIKKDNYDESGDAAMWLFSTNITDNENSKLIEDTLGELCSIKTRARRNPNSGNKIRLWVIPNTSL